MEILENTNSDIRFLLDVRAPVVLECWGYRAGPSPVTRSCLAAGVPMAGAYVANRALILA